MTAEATTSNDNLSVRTITVQHNIDTYPTLDYLGKYTDDHPGTDALKRGSAFNRGMAVLRGECRYFVCLYAVEDRRRDLQQMGYSKGQAEQMARKQCREDYERSEAFNRGDWCQIGIRASAVVLVMIGRGAYYTIRQTVSSSGLWGIESDSTQDYIQQVEGEQLDELRTILSAMGARIPAEVPTTYDREPK